MLIKLLMHLCSEPDEGTAPPKNNAIKRNVTLFNDTAVFGAFRRQGKQHKTLNNTAP